MNDIYSGARSGFTFILLKKRLYDRDFYDKLRIRNRNMYGGSYELAVWKEEYDRFF